MLLEQTVWKSLLTAPFARPLAAPRALGPPGLAVRRHGPRGHVQHGAAVPVPQRSLGCHQGTSVAWAAWGGGPTLFELILCLAVKEGGFHALTKPLPVTPSPYFTQQRAIFREKYANYVSAGRKRLSLCMVRGTNQAPRVALHLYCDAGSLGAIFVRATASPAGRRKHGDDNVRVARYPQVLAENVQGWFESVVFFWIMSVALCLIRWYPTHLSAGGRGSVRDHS